MAKILVVGSANADMVVRTDRFPQPGETIIGRDFHLLAGGKGANQAVAAARLGGDTTFVARVGDDIYGRSALDGYVKEGIDVSHITIDPDHPTGVASILVNKDGQNQIVVASGANTYLNKTQIDEVTGIIRDADIVLLQLESPIETVAYIIQLGRGMNKKVILNPAPAQELNHEILKDLFLITPNESEAGLLTGIEIKTLNDADKAANLLINLGVINVIITMGASGAFYKSAADMFFDKANKVDAIDTTAAGDVFNGALAVALGEDCNWRDAVRFATNAAGISVTRFGAQDSIPMREEVEKI